MAQPIAAYLKQWPVVVVLLASPLVAHSTDGDDSESSDADTTTRHGEEIIVTATRTDTTMAESVVATEVIGREQIELSGATTAADLFETHPGISIEQSFAGVAIRLQGLNPEHVLVLIDGQRVIGRKDGAIDLSRYPVDWIERIEIVKGASSVLYGSDAMGGVINIISRKPTGHFSSDIYGSYGTPKDIDGSGSISVHHGAIGSRVHGGYHTSPGYDLDKTSISTDGSARTMFHAGNITEIELTPDWTLTPRVSYRQQDSRNISESGSGAVFDARNLSEEVQAALGSDTWLTGTSRLRVAAFSTWYRDQFDNNQRDSDALDSYQDTQEVLSQGSIQYDRSIGDHNAATMGVDVLNENMESDRLGPGQGKRNRIGLFLQNEWTTASTKPLVVLPGVRFDLDSQFGFYPTPRLAIRYQPIDTLALRAGIGWGYRAPSFKELLLTFENPSAGYRVEGSPDLKPETSQNMHMSMEWTPTHTLWTSLSVYRNDVHDLIDFATFEDDVAGAPIRYAYVNIEEAVTQGGEINASVEPVDDLHLIAGYSYTDAFDVQTDLPLEGRSVHRLTGHISHRFQQSGTGISLRGAWNGPRPFYQDTDNDGEEERFDADPHTILHARVAQDLRFGKLRVRLFVGGENLLDEGEPYALPIPPRSYFAGLTGRFPMNQTTPSNPSKR